MEAPQGHPACPASSGDGDRAPNLLLRARILGIAVDCLSPNLAEDIVRDLLRSPARHNALVLAANPEKVLALRKEPRLGGLFARAAMILPDGVGLSLVMRWLHALPAGRVTGVDMMGVVVRVASQLGQRVFLLGARKDVNREAQDILARQYPGLHVAGSHGYLHAAEWERLPGRISEAGADVLLVALGSPFQEDWMLRHVDQLKLKLIQGVGGSLDVLTGRVPRAPAWMRRAGLEWLGRLAREPRRLRRQWRLPWFVCMALWDRWRTGPAPRWNHDPVTGPGKGTRS